MTEISWEESREMDKQIRPPFVGMVQDFNILRDLETQGNANNWEIGKDGTKSWYYVLTSIVQYWRRNGLLSIFVNSFSASTDLIQGIYLKQDDPNIIALMQQAEILSSLALKFDAENKDQSIDNAWKVRQWHWSDYVL